MTTNFGDARLEEFKLLSELSRVMSFNEPPSRERTRRRDLIAYLIDARYVNDLVDSALTEQEKDYHRSEILQRLFTGQEVRLTISHRGRVRLAELGQQLKTGRLREPLGVLIDGRHLDNDLQMALYTASKDAHLADMLRLDFVAMRWSRYCHRWMQRWRRAYSRRCVRRAAPSDSAMESEIFPVSLFPSA